MALPRDCYHHIFRPGREIPKFANSLHGHINVWSYFDLHLIWQTANGNVERGNALWPVTHKDLLAVGFRCCAKLHPEHISVETAMQPGSD
jgi:hypothetical protein